MEFPCSLKLGQQVTVNENSDYASDYRGEVWRVVGLALEPSGRINVAIAQDGFTRWDDETDGFSPEELTPA